MGEFKPRTAEEMDEMRQRSRATRSRRAEVRRALAAGEMSFGDAVALAGEEAAVGGMRVATLIRAVPGYGESRTRELMRTVGIAEGRHAAALTERQRTELVAAIDAG